MIKKIISNLQTEINTRGLHGAKESDSASIKFLQELELRSCDNCKHRQTSHIKRWCKHSN